MAGRWWLYVQAFFWRTLMKIGMYLHTVGWSRPPRPTFTRRVEFGPRRRHIDLYFYCPKPYQNAYSTKEGEGTGLFPVVVNFHGGGFTLGSATDDAYWAQCVVKEANAVFVSVGYRLAPEHPFPAAVDDGVEALLYLAAHANDLHLDTSRVTITGFSAGGNLAVTVPLRLQHRIKNEQGSEFLGPLDSTQNLINGSANLQIISVFSWYPILDFVASRDHRRAMSVLPDKTLPDHFTRLFDEAYLPDLELRHSPFASPERATDEMLADGLPYDVFLYTCEWDMLLNEGQRFVNRLKRLGKKVRDMMVEKVPHAWDKSPNPFRDREQVDMIYRAACEEMRTLFDTHSS